MRYLSISRLAFIAFTACFLGSCGSNITPVTGVTAPGLRYTGALGVVTLQLSGDALVTSGMKVYANDTECTNDSSKSETSRTAYCLITVPNTLEVKIRAINSSRETIYTTTLMAPMPQVTFTTSMGDFVLELNPLKAPITVNNFLSYVNKSPSFYNNTIFHRVVRTPYSIVQGGGLTSGMTPVTGQSAAITNESDNGLTNDRGTVAMARTSDPNSATSQFYINLINNTGFDYQNASTPGYAVFGTVVSGMDVIDNISTQPTHTVGSYSDVPTTDITVTLAKQTR